MNETEKPNKLMIEEYTRWCDSEIRWRQEKLIDFAKFKTLDISRELITFNLAVLAACAALITTTKLSSLLLVIVMVLNILSIMLSFWFMYKVTSENINYLTHQAEVYTEVKKLLENGNPFEAKSYHSEKLAFGEGKLRGMEKYWNYVQKGSISLFAASLVVLVAVLVVG